MPAKGKELPGQILNLLNAADERNGLPKGTMRSVLQQEVGGGADKYLADPSAYHYGLNADGKRIAGHTGKVSTAFGPFGILESTGANPGYGVKPLANKSLDEQVRFASDYLAARSKSAGGLVGGLAGYGEGAKYASQVVGRLTAAEAGPAPAQAPVVMAQDVAPPAWDMAAAAPGPVSLPPEILAALQSRTPAVGQAGQTGQADAWGTFLKSMPGRVEQPVNVADINYGNPQLAMNVPQFQFNPGRVASRKPNFAAFSSWTGRAA